MNYIKQQLNLFQNFTLYYWVNQGADPRKLVMGMPMYGQSFSLSSSKNHGLNAPSYGGGEAGDATRSRGFLSYYEVSARIIMWWPDGGFWFSRVRCVFRSATKYWNAIGNWSKTPWAPWARTPTVATNGYRSTTRTWLDLSPNLSRAMISAEQWYGRWTRTISSEYISVRKWYTYYR